MFGLFLYLLVNSEKTLLEQGVVVLLVCAAQFFVCAMIEVHEAVVGAIAVANGQNGAFWGHCDSQMAGFALRVCKFLAGVNGVPARSTPPIWGRGHQHLLPMGIGQSHLLWRFAEAGLFFWSSLLKS